MSQPQGPKPTGSTPPGTPSGNSPGKRLFLVLFVAVTLAVAGISVWTNLARWKSTDTAHAQATGMPAPQPDTVLFIESGGQKHQFVVEVARDDTQRAQGLMFRTKMDQNAGMLFDFKADLPVSMWMKNTYLPLDMLFIRKDGVIHRIEHRTEPMSEKTISAGGNVRSVLELNAGVAEKLGLKPGDRIIHPMFPAK
jgi:uncharacterized membrane protein (UPF0127 family)